MISVISIRTMFGVQSPLTKYLTKQRHNPFSGFLSITMVESVTPFFIQPTMNPLSIGYRTVLIWRIKQSSIFSDFALFPSLSSNATFNLSHFIPFSHSSILLTFKAGLLITWVFIYFFQSTLYFFLSRLPAPKR
ncbi:hypothetical protein BYT27DRAFT_6960467 [Phlegmacium glaucopus]|nr:hypothetical protein BYT27DRAFT_6960467 [Phlegmacium glaucopus]